MNWNLGCSVNRLDLSFSEEKACWDVWGRWHSQGRPDLSGRACSDLCSMGVQRNNGVLTFSLLHPDPRNIPHTPRPASKFSASMLYGIKIKWVCVSLHRLHPIHTRLWNLGWDLPPLSFLFAFFWFLSLSSLSSSLPKLSSSKYLWLQRVGQIKLFLVSRNKSGSKEKKPVSGHTNSDLETPSWTHGHLEHSTGCEFNTYTVSWGFLFLGHKFDDDVTISQSVVTQIRAILCVYLSKTRG